MFPQFKKTNNESGIVLFVVLMTAIIIMIFSVAILTQSMNELNYAQQQIDQISSEELAKGMWWNAYANGMNGMAGGAVSANLPGRNYQMMINVVSTGYISSYNVTVNYDTP